MKFCAFCYEDAEAFNLFQDDEITQAEYDELVDGLKIQYGHPGITEQRMSD